MKDGGPAFPGSVSADNGGGLNYGTPGMTLRDWFAGQAMNALLSIPCADVSIIKKLPVAAYGIADAMIAERSKSA